ncbi:MAG TPA: hypothetical protein ENI55_04500 [Alphaproteobacteria bacterium]|nr:hypothetical protein [Alphaproteobacteria bacterium]
MNRPSEWKMRTSALRLAVLFSLAFSATAFAQKPGDEWGVDVNGFALGIYSARTTGNQPPGGEGRALLLAEERVRLDVTGWTDAVDADVRIKLDGVHDAVTNNFNLDLREAYIDYTKGNADFRLGRQIITWGVGDLLFINDVFPKNWVSFFSGRPLEYLKTGVDGFKARYSSRPLNAEIIIIPRFEPDTMTTPKRFFMYDDYGSVTNRDKDLPSTTLGNTEIGLRLYGKYGGFDLSAYAYRGRWRTPGERADNPDNATKVTSIYPPLSVFGMSAQGSAFGGVLSLEGGYYDSRDDRGGKDPAVANSQTRFLVGYQTQLWRDFTIGGQYYTEIMSAFDSYKRSLPSGFAAKKKYRNIVTLRLTRFLGHQTWKLALFALYSPAESDYLLQPKITYKFSDNTSATLGGNIFGGKKRTTFFGQFDRDDNAYINLRYDF